MRTTLTLCCALTVAACGGEDSGIGPATATSGAGGSGSSVSSTSAATTGSGGGGVGGGASWTTLITGDWELATGTENTSDVHALTLDRDFYVGAIRPIAPLGTHHTVLALGNLSAGGVIYASGVGTNPLVFPDGVGLVLPAGQTLLLQLHIFNTTGDTLTGTSGIEVVEIEPSALQHEANLFLPGPLDFSIPPNNTYTHTGTCTVNTAQTLFAIFPHMHQLGSHFKTTVIAGGQPTVIHDSDYLFDDQPFLSFEPIAVQPGDTVSTECTWTNTTSQTVGWGESSNSEMCFSILYRYPALNEGFGFCDD